TDNPGRRARAGECERDPGHDASAAARNKDSIELRATLRGLTRDLETDCPLTRHDAGIVEGADKRRPTLFHDLQRDGFAVVGDAVIEYDLSAQRLCARYLRAGCVL